jgi:hypothetical protein
MLTDTHYSRRQRLEIGSGDPVRLHRHASRFHEKAFEQIATGISVAPALEELSRRGIPYATVRRPEGHAEMFPGPNRMMVLDLSSFERTYQGAGVEPYPECDRLVCAVLDLLGCSAPPIMAQMRCLVQGAEIKPHRDMLRPGRSRYHLGLTNAATMTIGGKSYVIQPGELIRVGLGGRLHGVTNFTPHERIILLVDVWDRDCSPAKVH